MDSTSKVSEVTSISHRRNSSGLLSRERVFRLLSNRAPIVAFYSDPVRLRLGGDSDDPALVGRKLAISEYVKGISGPLTWHAKAVTTSYITPQNSGDHTVINPPSIGPAAVDRLDRDVLGLSGLTSVVWLEGINDLGAGHAVNDIIAGYVNVVQRLHTAGETGAGPTPAERRKLGSDVGPRSNAQPS
jgi:hypothetical protein